jgi:hypothetical protein
MTTTPAPTVPTHAHLEAFFAKVDPIRARLIFALDATASRQPTWDKAAELQSQMFTSVAASDGIDIQLVYYRGEDECVASRWQSNAAALSAIMRRVTCAAGHTQICRVLNHARKENARAKVNALVLVGDAVEERAIALYGAARELAVPTFMFQEGTDEHVAQVFGEIALITGGAHCQFDSSAAQRLADLLKAVAAFAAGGVQALTTQKNEAARLLLTQLKKK